MSIYPLKSLRRFCIVILQHQVLPRLAYINRPVVGKTTILRQKSQKIQYYVRIATKLAKTVNIYFSSFNKITALQEILNFTDLSMIKGRKVIRALVMKVRKLLVVDENSELRYTPRPRSCDGHRCVCIQTFVQ